ncbi:MAG: aspartate aminotransferase family protein [Lysobacteraceae bacterium]
MSIPPNRVETAADAATGQAAYWMPFTANRQFQRRPRMLVSAHGMHYRSDDGRELLDGTAGLWCCNAGHARAPIIEAIARQAATLDYAPNFQVGHPLAFELAGRLAELAPEPLKHVFFGNSGSEAVDTALKIALAYHRLRGEGQRTRFIGREKGYHGVGFGGISVGGLANNRKWFGPLLPADHLRHTLDIERNAFRRGLPAHGAELADDLERLIALHDASTIAAVIVEPVAGSAGVILPPVGYLERLRQICDRHGILLIFDEVITGFGRVGKAFASQRLGVVPDMMTTAKGLTNGCVPMGATFVSRAIHEAFMDGPEAAIELFHGYTYSGHPLAAAAGLAALDVYLDEGLFERAIALEEHWTQALHAGLRGLANVIDIRTIGLVAGIELAARGGAPGARAFETFQRCFHDHDLLIRVTGDIIALSPPLIIEPDHIEQIVARLAEAIRRTP